MKPKITPRDHERHFAINELFFSTTDRKGIILSGNSVFARVAGFERVEELIGKPHNIIRHPDMPRSVFKLLWEYLDQGKSFAGYVKNLATDGSYYWVMALVVPSREGYISVRFKPGGQYFTIAKSLYAEMLKIESTSADGKKENDWHERMASSAEFLLEQLRESGFESYDEFMQTAIAAELTIRRDMLAAENKISWNTTEGAELSTTNEKLIKTISACSEIDRQLNFLFSNVASLLELIERLNQLSQELNLLSKEIKMVSLNGVIASNRLGRIGAGLSVVTQALTSVSGESTAAITLISGQLKEMNRLMQSLAFAITSAKLQVEMTLFFAHEILHAEQNAERFGARPPGAINSDIDTLMSTLSQSTTNMLDILPDSEECTAQLNRLKEQLSESLRHLSSIRVSGKVQAAYIAKAGYFQDLFENVYSRLEIASTSLQKLSEAIQILNKQLPEMTRTGDTVRQYLYESEIYL